MSFKRRIKHQYHSLCNFVRCISLPRWCSGVSMRIILVILFTAFGLSYIFETNNLSTSGYKIHELEKQVSSLSAEQEKLEIEKATYESMANIQKHLSDIKMVVASNIKYLKLENKTAVAKR